MSLAEFWSDFDIVYGCAGQDRSNLIKLLNEKGYFRKRIKSPAILRYYLNYSNDEDLARGLLILFMPFRDEMNDIHRKDVKKILEEKREMIEEKRSKFEKYKVMADLISNIQSDIDKNEETNEEEEKFEDEETTDPRDKKKSQLNNFTGSSEVSRTIQFSRNRNFFKPNSV